jgi:translocation and assembly module TamB
VKNWKRAAGWTALAIAGLVILLMIGAAVFLYSPAGHKYILRVAQRKATESIGAPVQVQSFNFDPSTLSLELNNVRVLGANGPPSPALLEVDRIHLQFKILSLVRREWRLQEVALVHPVVHLLTDASGATNIPQSKSNGSRTDVFQLAVQHAQVSRGEIYYNDQKSTLDAHLHDLSFESRFDNGNPRYFGTLSYQDGHLKYNGYEPLPHSLKAKFDATPQKFTLSQCTLTSGASRFDLAATLENYGAPRVQASYDALLATPELRRVIENSSIPTGVIHLKGSLHYQSEPNRPLLEGVLLQGDMSSAALEVRTPTLRAVVRDLGARYQIVNGDVEVRDLHAQLFGGELNGALTMRNLSRSPESRMEATLHGVSAADLKQLAGAQLRDVNVTGRADAELGAMWGRTMQNLVAHVDATLNGTMAPENGQTRTAAAPFNAAVHARYAAASGQIALTNSYVRLPRTEALFNGTVSKRSSLQVRVQANDLHELESLVSAFQKSPQPLGLSGQATFVGAVSGTTANPRITGQLVATNFGVRGTAWRLLRTNVSLSPTQASLENGVLQPAQQGRITFDVSAGLSHWSFAPSSPFTVNASASQVQLAQLARAAHTSAPVAGVLAANVALHGSELEPVGGGTVEVTQMKAGSETVQALNIRFQGTGDAVNATLSLRMPAGTAQGNVTFFPRRQAYEGTLQATNLRLNQLQTLNQRNMQVAGLLSVNASGKGTVKDPELQLTVQAPQLQVQGHPVTGLKLTGDLREHVARVTLDSGVADTYVRGRATVQVEGEYNGKAALDTSKIPLQPLLTAYLPARASEMRGDTQVHLSVEGPFKKPELLTVHLDIPDLSLSYRNLQLSAATPIRVDYSNGLLQVQRAEFKGTGTDLQVGGSVPLYGSAPASLTATGSVDLQLLKVLEPDAQSSGQVQFDVLTAGTITAPDIQGQVRIINANFETLVMPVGLQNANGTLTLHNKRIDVTQFQASVGGGTIQASGGVAYRPALQFDLAMTAKGVRLLYPEGVRTQIDSNLGLTGTTQAAVLRGAVHIDTLSFTPDFDLSAFINQFTGEVAPPPPQGFTQNIQLDVTVQSKTGLNLVSRTLSVRGDANLRVGGTAATPAVTGRVNLTGGDLIFLSNRYVIQGGTIDFVNPVRTEPVVNLRATTTIQQYNISLLFEGPFDRMRTTYTSNPALPPVDIIRLLATGKTTEAAAQQSTPATLGAENVLAGEISGAVTGRIAKIAGISQFSIDPNLGGTGSNRGPTILIQQRVTSKLFVTFSTDVTSTARQQFELQYQVTPRWGVSGIRDQNGGFGFSAQYRKTF